MYNKELWGGLTVVFAILFIICAAGTSFMFSWDGVINDALGIETVEIISASGDDASTLYYPSEFGDGTVSEKNEQALLAAAHEHGYNEQAEGSVLLKNDGVLPLCAQTTGKILVTGPNADALYNQLGDYTPPLRETEGTTVLQGLSQALGANIASGE